MPTKSVSYRAVAQEHHKKIGALFKDLRKDFPDLEVPAELAEYEEVYKVPFVHLVIIMFRKKAKAYARWHDALNNIPEKYRAQLPYCVPTRGKVDEVHVYPNVRYNITAAENMVENAAKLSFASTDIYKPFYDMYREETNDANKRARWATFERGKKVVLRHDSMSIARVLTRFTTMSADGITDAKIRDYATAIQMDMQPMQLIFCQKPEDFVEMYGSGPSSCMSKGSSSATKWSQIVEEGFHPATFYHYHPNFGGVYIRKHGKVAARCVLIKYMPGSIPREWRDQHGPSIAPDNSPESFRGRYHGRIYGDNDEIKRRFLTMLREYGLKDYDGRATVAANFDLPGFYSKIKRDYLAPVPYIDGKCDDVYVTFDVPTKTFRCRAAQTAGSHALGGYDTGGLKEAKPMVSGLTCEACNGRIKIGEHIGTLDGVMYCSADCAHADGYMTVLDGRGEHIWTKPNDNMATDRWDPLAVWTNREAMRRNGGLPALVAFDDNIASDTAPMTTHGSQVRFNGTMCRMNGGMLARIKKGSIPGATYKIGGDGIYDVTVDKVAMAKARAERNASRTKIDW